MDTGKVSGVVVTFHPDADVLENLAALCQQLRHVVVVDNGSNAAEAGALRAASERVGFELIENGANLGIATGLNVGVRRAQAAGADYVLLFDQDSQVTPHFAEAMLACFVEIAATRKLGVLVPTYVDKRLGNAMESIFEHDGQMETAMTSGSMVRMETLATHGLFMDELFIDGVDHEFSLRLRAAGYTLEECRQAVLLHSPGSPTVHTLPWRAKPFHVANYPPIRRYYQERNKILLIRRYWREFGPFCVRQLHSGLKDLGKILLFETNKLVKLGHFFLGTWHGLMGRSGKMPGS